MEQLGGGINGIHFQNSVWLPCSRPSDLRSRRRPSFDWSPLARYFWHLSVDSGEQSKPGKVKMHGRPQRLRVRRPTVAYKCDDERSSKGLRAGPKHRMIAHRGTRSFLKDSAGGQSSGQEMPSKVHRRESESYRLWKGCGASFCFDLAMLHSQKTKLKTSTRVAL